MRLLTILLNFYIWGAVCALLFFLFAIARFYQKKSGRRSYYPAFMVSIGLFGLAALRYAFVAPAIAGDIWGDSLRLVASLIVGGVGLFLLKLMIGRQQP